MQTGVITYFNDEKGFGFIKVDGTGPNDKGVFFHFKQFEGGNKQGIVKGTRVQFTIKDADRGPAAEDISRISDDAEMSAPSMEAAPAAEEAMSVDTDMDTDSDDDMDMDDAE